MDINFNKYDALDKETILDLLDTPAGDIDTLLTKINEIALDKYDLGFDDGYNEGESVGYADGWYEGRED